jgi:hypothetical protein
LIGPIAFVPVVREDIMVDSAQWSHHFTSWPGQEKEREGKGSEFHNPL